MFIATRRLRTPYLTEFRLARTLASKRADCTYKREQLMLQRDDRIILGNLAKVIAILVVAAVILVVLANVLANMLEYH
jgi:hypothetical protein